MSGPLGRGVSSYQYLGAFGLNRHWDGGLAGPISDVLSPFKLAL